MHKYLSLLQKIMEEGEDRECRNGNTRALFFETRTFDLTEGFPIVTAKKMAVKAMIGETLAFLRGYDNVKDFQKLGCNFWNHNANSKYWLENKYNKGDGDLGRIYGVQWRNWGGDPFSYGVDQIANVTESLMNDPFGRRHVVTAWNPGELHEMALPPCHMLFQFFVADGDYAKKESGEPKTMPYHYLDMTMFQRSCDAFLGVPFNISSYALILSLMAKVIGAVPRKLNMVFDDLHIYHAHFEQVEEILQRDTFALPTLRISHDVEEHVNVWDFEPKDISLFNYQSGAVIEAPMIV